MIIGKTSSSISKTEIFTKFSEAQVLGNIFPEVKTLPCLICSPLRIDKHPSFSLYISKENHVRYKDHATGEQGSLLDLLCNYWGCSFDQAIDKLCKIFIDKKDITIRPKIIKTLPKGDAKEFTDIQVQVRPWRDYDLAYWESYGVTKEWLKYAEVYPISYKIVTRKNPETGETKEYTFPADKYAYCFVEHKEGITQLKIYQPYNTKGFKWCSCMDVSVISLWTKVPEFGDRIVICSSLKDALCLSCNLNIPSVCLQGEAYGMSDTAVAELKRRYKKVFICFDTDKPGKKDSTNLASKTGFINVIPDLGMEKDISDYWKSLEDKTQFKHLKDLFN